MTALALLAALAVTTGRPSVLASVDEDRVDDTINGEFYPLLEETPVTADQLAPHHRRNKKAGVVVGKTLIRKAFAGSDSTLSGYPACIALANEAGLWPANKLRRLIQRTRLFPFDSKVIVEGKPEEKDRCALTAMVRSDATDRRYRHCKCPHCGTYQRLVWGWGKPGTGLKWDKGSRVEGRGTREKPKSDPLHAAATAYYECTNGCRITDADRPAFLRAGVWLSEGQSVTKAGKVRGRRRVNSSTVAFDGLSTLYSLAISGWGQIATEFFDCKDDPEALREFITGTLAEEYDPVPAIIEPDQLIVRLGVDEPLRVCPEWSRFLTEGVDVGRIGDDLIFYWLVAAWGLHARGQLVDFGIAWGVDEYRQRLLSAEYKHADGGPPLRPVRTGVDSGTFTNSIYDFCQSIPNCWPTKGSTHSDFPDMYRFGFQRADVPKRLLAKKIKHGFGDLLILNSDRSQKWVNDQAGGIIKPEARNRFTIPMTAFYGEVQGIDLASHLLGDVQDDKGRWIKRYEDQDFRDSLRNAAVMAWHFRKNGAQWDQDIPRSEATTKPPDPARDKDRKRFVRKPKSGFIRRK